MINKKINRLNIYQFKNLSKYEETLHFITTRNNGVSPEPFDSLNLGYNCGDNIKNVEANWGILKKNLDLNDTKTLTLNQVHSDKVIIIDRELKDDLNHKIKGDAIITNLKGVCISVLVADCVPTILYDPVKKAAAVVHAGWRGSFLKIAKNTVKTMEKAFLSNPEDIIAGIGPSIGPCCYEVKNDVAKNFINYRNAVLHKNKSYFLNLWTINKLQLMESGINENNIEVSGLCTSCNKELFFSYRKENPTGRFAAGVIIKWER